MSASPNRVYFLTNHPLWTGEAYAARVLSEADAVRARGVPTGFIRILSARAWRDPMREQQRGELESAGSPVIDLLQPPDLSRSSLRRFQTLLLRRALRRVLQRHRVGVIHAEGVRAGSLAVHAPAATKVVLDVHGDVEAEARLAFENREGELRAGWARADTKDALRRADAVLSVSERMTAWLNYNYRPEIGASPIVEVPCGVDVERFALAARKNPGFRVLYLGGLQAYQPPHLIAEACHDLAALVPDADFMVITPRHHDTVRDSFASLGLKVAVRSATPEEVPSLMGGADLGIVPRIDDQVNRVACPTKIGEYLAAGVPVACSAYVGGWADWLAERRVGFALQAPPEEILAAVQRIRGERAEVAARCRAVAEESWAWGRLGERLVNVYTRLGTHD